MWSLTEERPSVTVQTTTRDSTVRSRESPPPGRGHPPRPRSSSPSSSSSSSSSRRWRSMYIIRENAESKYHCASQLGLGLIALSFSDRNSSRVSPTVFHSDRELTWSSRVPPSRRANLARLAPPTTETSPTRCTTCSPNPGWRARPRPA